MIGRFFCLRRLGILAVLVCLCFFVEAQDVGEMSEELVRLWEEYAEAAVESESGLDPDDLYEQFQMLWENPVDLNSADRQELESIPFLSAAQREQLALYLYRQAPLQTLSQLLMVPAWDDRLLARIRPFVCLKQPSGRQRANLLETVSHGRSQVRFKTEASLQVKQGYKERTDSAFQLGKSYVGSPLAGSLRYRYACGRRFQCGFGVEKDAGEHGLDFAGAYALLKTDGCLKTLALGDYKISLAQGLMVSSGTFGGKTSAGNVLSSGASPIRPHASTAESGFFRGAAIELTPLPHFRCLEFVSCRKLDADREGNTFTNFKTDGFHRTFLELSRRRQVSETLAGGRLSFETECLQLSANGIAYFYNANRQADPKPYNLFYFRGKRGANISLDGRLLLGETLLGAEWAADAAGHTAALVSVSHPFHPLFDCFFSYRNYQPEYQAPYASSFGENSLVANEQGFFMRADCRLFKHVEWIAYADVFRFPWLKYGVSAPSEGTDLMLEARVSPGGGQEVSVRLSRRSKAGNSPAETGAASTLQESRSQCRVQWTVSEKDWRFKTNLSLCSYEENDGSQRSFRILSGFSDRLISWESKEREPSSGWLLAQEIRYRPEAKPYQLAVQYAQFDTDSYDSRLSLYSPDLTGSFPIATLSGKGGRLCLLAQWDINSHIQLGLRLKHLFYADRELCGNGLEQSDGHCQSQWALQVRVK